MWDHADETTTVWPGRNWPLGATWTAEATNFAVYAPRASAAWVCLFDETGTTRQRIELTEHSLGIWHCAVPGAGPRHPLRLSRRRRVGAARAGCGSTSTSCCSTPTARPSPAPSRPSPAIFGHVLDDPEERSPLDSAPYVPRSVVVNAEFDWEGDVPLRRRWRDSVIYELHVKGMTALHDRVPEELRGTYAGLATPAVTDYLRDLGVTAVELLPIHQFFSEPALAEHELVNYWGYNSLGFFAPHNAYSASGDRGEQVREFKAMVKAFHAAGLEVILDVVYNHTAEAGRSAPRCRSAVSTTSATTSAWTPPTSWRRLAEPPTDTYWDVTGCGNTVDATHTQSLRLILDSLRYWVNEMHVDGFRFDLLSALTRTDQQVDMGSHLLTAIGQDPVLRHVKLIAEPWDASMDGYRVGSSRRRGWSGTTSTATRCGTSGAATPRACGPSPPGSPDRATCTPMTAVRRTPRSTSSPPTTASPCATSCPTTTSTTRPTARTTATAPTTTARGTAASRARPTTPRSSALRRRQAANLMATLCFSNGVPMLTAGDERGRTQGGNNNAYGQDNEISWIDWRPDDAWLDVYEITKTALRLRRDHPALRQRHWFEGRPTIKGGPKDLIWLHPCRARDDGRRLARRRAPVLRHVRLR